LRTGNEFKREKNVLLLWKKINQFLFQQNMKPQIFFFLIFISFDNCIEATHFQGGTITYKVLNMSGSILSVLLTQTYIYDYSKINCNSTMIVNQSPKLYFNSGYPTYYFENNQTVKCILNCNQSGGYIAPGVVTYCTDYSSPLDITIGQREDIINVTNGSYFLVAYQSLSWRALALPSGSSNLNTNWSIPCLIDLQIRSDGTYNHPPVAIQSFLRSIYLFQFHKPF
jgi:hypothetical protein